MFPKGRSDAGREKATPGVAPDQASSLRASGKFLSFQEVGVGGHLATVSETATLDAHILYLSAWD